MFTKYYNVNNVSLALGIALYFTSNYITNNMALNIALKFAGVISFIVSFFYYYKIVTEMKKITNLTNKQLTTAIIAQIIMIVGLCLYSFNDIFRIVFFGSVFARQFAGISAYGPNLKYLCNKLDEHTKR